MANTMYAAVRRLPKPRWDKKLWLAITASVLFIAIVVSPMVWAAWYQRQFRLFTNDLADSTNYARRHGSLTMTKDGERFVLDPDRGFEYFLIRLAGVGSGRIGDAPVEPPLATVEFGNGAALELWSVRLEGYVSSDLEYDLYLRYTYPDGKVYGYDNEFLDPVPVLRMLTQSVIEAKQRSG